LPSMCETWVQSPVPQKKKKEKKSITNIHQSKKPTLSAFIITMY
jgi:hypothetical protein